MRTPARNQVAALCWVMSRTARADGEDRHDGPHPEVIGVDDVATQHQDGDIGAQEDEQQQQHDGLGELGHLGELVSQVEGGRVAHVVPSPELVWRVTRSSRCKSLYNRLGVVQILQFHPHVT